MIVGNTFKFENIQADYFEDGIILFTRKGNGLQMTMTLQEARSLAEWMSRIFSTEKRQPPEPEFDWETQVMKIPFDAVAFLKVEGDLYFELRNNHQMFMRLPLPYLSPGDEFVLNYIGGFATAQVTFSNR